MCASRMQHEAMILNSTTVEEEFNVTANYTEADIQRLCRIVTYYYFVEAIDNDSNIYYYLKQNALDALAYWVSFTSYFFATSLLLFLYSCVGPCSNPFSSLSLDVKIEARKSLCLRL